MSEIIWRIEKRKLSELKDHSKNPKTCSQKTFEMLKASISKFGFIDKPFINTDNTIIGGHLRKRVLFELGYDEIEVYVPSRPLDEKEVDELCVKHNLYKGDWDYDILANEFDPGDLVQWGFDDLFEERPAKRQKPKITLTFDDDQSCKTFANELYGKLSPVIMTTGAKVKIKGNING